MKIKEKSFEVEVIAPDTEEEANELRQIIKEIKTEDKNRNVKNFTVIDNRKK